MKMSVIYHSKSGNTKRMAEVIVEGMMSVEGVEAKAFSIDDVDETWAKESKCLIFGTPIYMACLSEPMYSWLHGPCAQLGLAGKIGGAFATANFIHGGGDLAIRTILDHLLTYGMMAYSGGGSFGQPVIHIGPVAIAKKLEESDEIFKLYGQRMATKTVELFK
ncbi:MAG: hypothetical protein GX127_08285 [Eubacteriaceae bacterium]|jgi:NAD(P)H dehydrogenase (quinone)|nr:hypothetical protein [Eubacteriaceae bacterium]